MLLAVIALARGGDGPLRGDLYLLDGAAGLFLALIAVVGLCSALVSPSYLRTAGRGWLGAARSRRWYYTALYAFWAVLLAVPIAGNLAVAWLLVEATTAASALLIAFTGRRDALEAGWKYLVLTTLGLAVALLGHRRAVDRGRRRRRRPGCGRSTGTRSSAAPRRCPSRRRAGRVRADPRRARDEDRLGARAQLAARTLTARRRRRSARCCRRRCCRRCCSSPGASRRRSTPPSATRPPAALFIAFGLASLVVAVPFLWRALPWKRLLAYSSLEHMGVIALGIGFGTPLAIAGVVDPRRRSRAREGAGLLRRAAAPARRPGRRAPRSARRQRDEPADRDRDGRQPRRARRRCRRRRSSSRSC